MQEKRHDRVVEMRLCFFSGKVGDYKMLFAAIRKCCSTVKGKLKIVKQGEVLDGFSKDFVYEVEKPGRRSL